MGQKYDTNSMSDKKKRTNKSIFPRDTRGRKRYLPPQKSKSWYVKEKNFGRGWKTET